MFAVTSSKQWHTPSHHKSLAKKVNQKPNAVKEMLKWVPPQTTKTLYLQKPTTKHEGTYLLIIKHANAAAWIMNFKDLPTSKQPLLVRTLALSPEFPWNLFRQAACLLSLARYAWSVEADHRVHHWVICGVVDIANALLRWRLVQLVLPHFVNSPILDNRTISTSLILSHLTSHSLPSFASISYRSC